METILAIIVLWVIILSVGLTVDFCGLYISIKCTKTDKMKLGRFAYNSMLCGEKLSKFSLPIAVVTVLIFK